MMLVTPERVFTRRIAFLHEEATRLLDVATHETMKRPIRLAERDLNDALAWLGEARFDSRPALQEIVRRTVDLATWRMNAVSEALKQFGPDAEEIG